MDCADDLVVPRSDLRPRLAARGLIRTGRQLALLSGTAFTVPAGMLICSLEVDADGEAWGCTIGTAVAAWAEHVQHAFTPTCYLHSTRAASYRLPWRPLLHAGRSWCISKIVSVSQAGLCAALLDVSAQVQPPPRTTVTIASGDFAIRFPTLERL